MKKHKIVLYLTLFCTVIFLASCEKTPTKVIGNDEQNKEREINLTQVMALSVDGSSEKLLKIDGMNFKAEENISNVKDIKYNIANRVYAYLNIISEGKSFAKNYVTIMNNGKSFYLKKDFSYMDMTLSNNGSMLALRSFSKDSLTSPEGLSVYSTSDGKKLNFDKDVIVSGDLYRWQDSDNLLYYGVTNSEGGYGKIYKYDFKNDKKSIKFDKLQGYCLYFIPLPNLDMIYIESNVNKSTVNYYDEKQNKVESIGNNVEQIDNYVIDNVNNIVYYIGKEVGSSYEALYKVELKDKKISRLTFDFPTSVDKDGGMAMDKNGRVYFCGGQSEYDSSNIYMYDKNNKSTNLISNKSGIYHIVSEK